MFLLRKYVMFGLPDANTWHVALRITMPGATQTTICTCYCIPQSPLLLARNALVAITAVSGNNQNDRSCIGPSTQGSVTAMQFHTLPHARHDDS